MYQSILYVEIDVFAALVLFIIIDRSRNSLISTDQHLFNLELISIIAVLIFDAFTWSLNMAAFPGAETLNLLFCYLYWFSTLFPCYIGLLYCANAVSEALYLRWRWIFALPIFFGAGALAANLWNGWIFTVSAENVYARGPHFLLVGCLPFFHMAAAVLLTVWKYLHTRIADRKKFVMLTIFMLIPLIGSLLQIFFYGLVTIWIGLTLSMLMCYVYIQNGSLSTDPLTHLNNRGCFDRYASWKWETLRENENLYLLILDINRFKAINDTYGHAEGDLALIRAAGVLRQAMSNEKGFLARIGGDEFAILLSNVSESAVGALTDRIRNLLEAENCSAGESYRLSFSVGYAGTDGSRKMDFAKLFSQADEAMYIQKRSVSGTRGEAQLSQ